MFANWLWTPDLLGMAVPEANYPYLILVGKMIVEALFDPPSFHCYGTVVALYLTAENLNCLHSLSPAFGVILIAFFSSHAAG